jgi:hypothetical protein
MSSLGNPTIWQISKLRTSVERGGKCSKSAKKRLHDIVLLPKYILVSYNDQKLLHRNPLRN